MIKNLPILCLTFFNFYVTAQNFVVTYGFSDVSTNTGTIDPGITPTVNGLTFGSFSSTGASANPGASGRFAFTNWPLGGVNAVDDYSNFTGALSPTVYYEVSVGVNAGYTLSLNTLTFSMRRSGTGIRNYCVRSNLDGYTNNLAASTGTATKLSVLPGNEFFWNYDSVATSSDQKGSTLNLGSQFSALTNTVVFRFFAWNAESGGGSFSIDNVSFTGSVVDSLVLLGTPRIGSSAKNCSGIKVFPNPNTGKMVTVEVNKGCDLVEIISITGAVVHNFHPAKDESAFKLNLSQLPDGIYFIKAYSSCGTTLGKIILSRN